MTEPVYCGMCCGRPAVWLRDGDGIPLCESCSEDDPDPSFLWLIHEPAPRWWEE